MRDASYVDGEAENIEKLVKKIRRNIGENEKFTMPVYELLDVVNHIDTLAQSIRTAVQGQESLFN